MRIFFFLARSMSALSEPFLRYPEVGVNHPALLTRAPKHLEYLLPCNTGTGRLVAERSYTRTLERVLSRNYASFFAYRF